MVHILIYVLMALYALSILFILIHSLFDAHLIFHYLRSRRKGPASAPRTAFFPRVTIQLPVYNEVHVVERLLEAVAAIEYPADKLEVQVLDDSNDETSGLIALKIDQLRSRGIPFKHIRRSTREGFKAGALKHGLSQAEGEFVAVFDADFVPQKDFLLQTISFFDDPTVGMVQTKWGHLNKESSMLSKLQAMALDGHFSIEQRGRNAAGFFMNFNGTGGVWRKSTILDAGNWSADALTEDFDLSCRAQLKGWKFVYLEHIATPAELPPILSAFKTQQFRWMKGGAETARKNLQKLLSARLPLPVKLHGILQLTYNLGFVSFIICAVATVPLMFVKQNYPEYTALFAFSQVVGVSSYVYLVHHFISYYNNWSGTLGRKIFEFSVAFPLFGALFIGMSLNNSVAIVQGYMGIKSGFVRTPKFSTVDSRSTSVRTDYTGAKIDWVSCIEGLLAVYFLFGVIQAIAFRSWGTLPLLLMALTGFAWVFIMGIQEKWVRQLAPAAVPA